MREECLFCEIAHGQAAADVIWVDERHHSRPQFLNLIDWRAEAGGRMPSTGIIPPEPRDLTHVARRTSAGTAGPF